jgi:branched-subunit amino acid ABC-type transport system permease component
VTLGTWITSQLVFGGLVNGLAIGLVALGLVLTYRSTRVINFAVGNMGLPAAALMALMTINYNLGFWFSLVVSLVVGMAFAAAVELVVVGGRGPGPPSA